MSVTRIRQILPRLNYDVLVRDGVIPDIESMTKHYPNAYQSKRYPPFVYDTQCYSDFGMFMDYVIRAGLRLKSGQTIDLGQDPLNGRIQSMSEADMLTNMLHLSQYESSTSIDDIAQAVWHLLGNLPFDSSVVQRYIPILVNMNKDILALWTKYVHYLSGIIRYNVEFVCEDITGHPDIVTDTCILDIKTTTSFDKMAKESCLQILAYHALRKQSGSDTRYVGFILPLQRDIIICDLQGWDPSKYLQVLLDNVERTPVMNLQHLQNVERIMLGGHIEKGHDLQITFRDHANNCSGRPCQLFLSNPRSGKRDAKMLEQITGAAKIVKDRNIQFFTHAPYIINLCANLKDAVTNVYWQQKCLNDDLKTTVELGGRGVVVHVGARRNLSEEVALKNMEDMVRSALQYATESCPLLLETPCGEGTEVCTSVTDLAKFYTRFSTEERKKLGLCVDSAHVFACGYDPVQYVKDWVAKSDIPIVLVHFNDSRGAKGSCVDRHAPCGKGYIGMAKMQELAIWAHQRNIPLVQE